MIDSDGIKKLLGKRIREFRIKNGYTQEHMAELIQVGQRNLSRIECGNNFVSAETLCKILSILNIEAKELFDFNHKKDKEVLRAELVNAINSNKVDIELLYHFYETIK